MTLSTQRTMYNTDLHLAMLFGSTYTCLPYTTLNEKFSISNGNKSVIKDSVYPILRYLTIGTGGTPGINESRGFILSEHTPLDAALFNHVPFAMLKDDEDMDADEQENYRFKRKEVINGETYNCYYLRLMNITDAYDNKFQTIRNVNNESFISTFNTNRNLINPTPKSRKVDYENITETNFITKLCKITVTFSETELKRVEQVFKIKGYKSNVLSEMGLCSGIEVRDQQTGKRLEPVDVQLMFFLDMNLDLTYSFNTGEKITKYIEVGGAEPMVNGIDEDKG